MTNKNKNINEDKKIDLEIIEKEMDGKKGG